MWLKTIKLYPHLQEIKDYDYILAILVCTNEVQQDKVLDNIV